MPKDKRRRTALHEQPIRLSKRQFAVQDDAVEHVDVGAQADASGTEILQSVDSEAMSRPLSMKKKEKQALKHELFMQRLESAPGLESSRAPYSKSRERRLRRKAREQLAEGVDDLKAVISEMDEDIPSSVVESARQCATDASTASQRRKALNGLIGEGKGAPFTKAERKRALKLERQRIPLILSTPEFASNPFQTIRIHAQNTLVKHQPPE